MVKDFTKPAEYTGELLGVEYLYQQTGRVLEDVSLDPDTPDEAAAIESLEEVDEGIEEDVEDPTIFEPDTPSTSTATAAARSGDPADAPRSEPSSPAAPDQDAPPEAPEVQAPAPQQSSSDSEEEMQGPDGRPGYQHVLKLAKALLEAWSLQGLSDRRVDKLVTLWNRLPDGDKRRVVYPPRHRERQPRGRFKAAKGKDTSCPGKGGLQRCLLGLNSGPASWPSVSRLVEAICSQLCRLHPTATRFGGITRTRWSLILTDYMAIREAVLDSPRLMAQTEIQLFELNQRTLSQWFSWRQKEGGRAVLQQGTGVVPAPAVAAQPLPPAKGLSSVQVGRGQPFHFHVPEEQPGPSDRGLPPPPPPPPPASAPPPPPLAPAPAPLPGTIVAPAPATRPPPLPAPQQVPRSTAYRKRKAAEAAAAGQGPLPGSKTRGPMAQYVCDVCGQPERLDTGHTCIAGVSYCAAAGGKSVEEWKEEMRRRQAGDQGGD